MRRLRHPIRTVGEPFGTAGLIVAMIALVAALGGSALAANGALSGKQKKEVEKIAKKFSGKPGPAGATGPAGPAGGPGKEGSAGKEGTSGKEGTAGKAGTDGTTGFTKTLPSGQTETGAWTLEQPALELPEENPVPYTSVSFSIPLAAELDEEHVVLLGEGKEGTEHEAECPGSTEEPLAAKGYLCVYTTIEQDVSSAFLQPPASLSTKGAGTNGAIIRVNPTTEEEPLIGVGSWAVTAP
jgi:Collagen triple helix repeat (20 copies)